MFAYCTEVLHLSEAEAYLRIAAARASREHPLLLTMLADGRLHLTAIAKLAPHLTVENREALLKRAAHRSRRQIEDLVAELAPRPDAPAVVRKLPGRRDGTMSPGLQLGPDAEVPSLGLRPEGGASVDRRLRPDGVAPPEPELRLEGSAGAGFELRPHGAAVLPGSRPAVVEPLGAARYKVQFTASAELHDKLERLRALMRPSVPDGDLAAIVEQAVTEKLQGLEFHHRHPFGRGGDHSVANVSLACRCHNGYLAEVDYGREAIARHRRPGTRPSKPTPSPSP
jgi:hypothetical protein